MGAEHFVSNLRAIEQPLPLGLKSQQGTAGPNSFTSMAANPGGDVYLLASERRTLGVGQTRVGFLRPRRDGGPAMIVGEAVCVSIPALTGTDDFGNEVWEHGREDPGVINWGDLLHSTWGGGSVPSRHRSGSIQVDNVLANPCASGTSW